MNSVFITLFLPASLFIIMFSLGMALTIADFRRVVLFPRGITIGLLNLLLISPLLAFTLAVVFRLPPELAVGMVLLGASPGGTTANMLTHLARGDTALSITMTAISSVAAVVMTPLVLSLASAHFMSGELALQLDMSGIVVKVLIITLIPLSLGMLVRANAEAWALRHEPLAKKIAMVFFVLVVAAALWSERTHIGDNLAVVGFAVLSLNVLAMTISYILSTLAGLNGRQATAVSIELGVHNTTLAMAVGAMVTPTMVIPAAVYGVFMFFTAGAFARWMHQRNADPA
ncbi:MAG: bile acid:sodium symporter family protein [Pseudomonadota bacterium]